MILAALCLALATGASGCDRVHDAVFGSQVRSYLMRHPEVIEEAVLKLEETKMAEAEAEVQRISQTLIPRYRDAIERDTRDYVANPNGTITVTQFFDYRCGYCRQAAPEVIRMIAENPDVRFVFKEFPIFGGTSEEAAAAALAAHRQGKYMSVYRAFFEPRNLTPEAMQAAIGEAGLDPAAIKKAAGDPAIVRHLRDNQRLAQSLQINGTPTFVVGDRMVMGADIPAIEAAIAEARRAKA